MTMPMTHQSVLRGHSRAWYMVLLALLSLSSLSQFSHVSASMSTVLNVNTGLSYATIQDAIDANETLASHVISVSGGTYVEHVVVHKPITLTGEGKDNTIIDGNMEDDVLEVAVGNVSIVGFTIRNSNPSQPFSGVLVRQGVVNVKISSCLVTDNFYGVALLNSSRNNLVVQNSITRNNYGIVINSSFRNTVSGNDIRFNLRGILIRYSSSDNTISWNVLTVNDFGILSYKADGNIIEYNRVVENNYDGLQFSFSLNNSVQCNDLSHNQHYGVRLSSSSANRFFQNNFINNGQHVYLDSPASANYWNSSYPLGGNYWDNYESEDRNLDGLGERRHDIASDNVDHHPLLGTFTLIRTCSGGHLGIVSNSTIIDFQCFEENSTIRIHVSNASDTQAFGFCRIRIPHILLPGPYEVIVDGGDPIYANYGLHSVGEITWIYFSYRHSEVEIIILKELPFVMMIALSVFLVLFTVGSRKGSHS